jgi:hypothetical protein
MRKVSVLTLVLLACAIGAQAQSKPLPKLSAGYALAAQRVLATAQSRHIVLQAQVDELNAQASNDVEVGHAQLFTAIMQLETLNYGNVALYMEAAHLTEIPESDKKTLRQMAQCFAALKTNLMRRSPAIPEKECPAK